MNKFWSNPPLSRVIDENVYYHRVDIERVKPGKKMAIQTANDEFFVTDKREALGCFAAFLFM